MSAADEMPVLIAGGGIGGLAAALALGRRGVPVHVLEAEAGFSGTGAGIQIGPNGSRILRALGLGEALQASAAQPEAIIIKDGLSGRQLAAIPLGGEAENRYGAPYYVAERRALHRLLLDAASQRREVRISTDFKLVAFRKGVEGLAALSDDGREFAGRALIGADGIHSRLRSILFEAAPVFSGRNAWRATAPADHLAPANGNTVNLWLGPRAHLVHYSCGPAGRMNAVAVTSGAAASPGWGTRGDPLELSGFFADWTDEPLRMLNTFDEWMTWPLLEMAPLPNWGNASVTLLGDAAHPLMPFLASGAVMALEDAETLAAEMVDAAPNIQTAFRRYEQRRMPRVGRVQRQSAKMGEIYHMSGAMRLARNLTLTVSPPALLLARNDWLYGYRIGD